MISTSGFIEDFRKLFLSSPQCGSWTRASENCDYGDIITVSKDCYMCFNSGNCRDAYYCEDSRALTDCTDCTFCENCELSYECVDCNNCYGCRYCQDCVHCDNVYFSYDLRRCKNCFGCSSLRDREYYIFNKPYTEDSYKQELQKLIFLDNETIFSKLEEIKKINPRMFVHQYDSMNCTGDYIYHSKNCHMCFDTRHTEDSGYIYQANLDMGTKDSFDCGPIPTGMDLCYDVAYSHYLFNCKHLYWCGNLKDSQYCTNCFESENLFGCNYLKNKEKGFWILNQKVDQEIYKKFISETKKKLKKRGIYTLYDLLNKDLSMSYPEVSDSETDRCCQICNEEFNLIPSEIEFYKKMDISFPVYCPDCRATQRFKLRNERKMYKRKCDSCSSPLITTYPVDSKYIVYCLDCYWKNIN